VSQPALWRRIAGYFRPPPIRTVAELEAYLHREAAQLAQYTTYEFSRNTLGYFGQHAFWHEQFQAHMRVCRWEAFAAVLADLVILAEARLRPAAEPPELLVEPLGQVYRRALASYPVPAHRPDGWTGDVEALILRLRQAQLAEPHGPNQVARAAGRRIFEVLPIYSGNNPSDFETIGNMIRMGEVKFHVQLVRCLDVRAVVADVGA
jgi:hypothetical protein